MTVLDVQQVSKSYGAHAAVSNVSIRIQQGEIFGLLGPNGAGKSSLLRMITGITNPDQGQILFQNEAVDLLKHSKLIGYMPEERGLYKKMKVKEQAVYLTQLKGLSKANATKAVNHWFTRLDMQSWAEKKVQDLSKGMSQKLQFVITVAHKPSLLILDEPFSGLDPVNSEIIKQQIFELSNQGVSIIFSTHRMEQVEEICKEIALLHQGKIVLHGNVKEIKQQFKEHLYLLKTNALLQGFEQAIVSQSGFEYHLKLEQASDSNEILKSCLAQQLTIIEFKEILPTLNEIFISQVAGTAVRQFKNQ
jgi:ABC-2 type transport system ATP-binding protein